MYNYCTCVCCGVGDAIYDNIMHAWAAGVRNKLDPQHREKTHRPENKYHIIIFVYRLTRDTPCPHCAVCTMRRSACRVRCIHHNIVTISCTLVCVCVCVGSGGGPGDLDDYLRVPDGPFFSSFLLSPSYPVSHNGVSGSRDPTSCRLPRTRSLRRRRLPTTPARRLVRPSTAKHPFVYTRYNIIATQNVYYTVLYIRCI